MADITATADCRRQGLGDKLRQRFMRAMGLQRKASNSSLSSECSTLIDFVVDVNDDVSEILSRQCEFVAPEILGWTLRNYRSTSSSTRTLAVEAELLEEENCAWGMPTTSPRSSPSRRKFFSFNKQSSPRTKNGGMEAQMLDPEDCAWM